MAVSTASIVGGPKVHTLHSSRRAFSSGKLLATSRKNAAIARQPQRVTVRAATRRGADDDDEEEAAKPAFDLRSLFGSGAKQDADEAPRSGSQRVSARGGSQKVSPRTGSQKVSVRGGSQKVAPRTGSQKVAVKRGGTTRVGVRRAGTTRIGARGGTTRIGMRGKQGGTQRIGLFGGTQRIGSGTQRIGARDGPRGLFGGASGRKDPKLVFVAGGTGRLGARIVRQLINQGYKVRVGVRDTAKAEGYLETAIAYGLLPRDAARRIQCIAYDIAQPETIPSAIGAAAKVVCAIGANESLNFGGPKKIDGEGTINIVNAAKGLGVDHFILVTSLGTGKIGWPAGILNLFGGVLLFKKKAEEALEQSGMRYTIVRPGGMEKPGDDYAATHNLRLEPRDTLFGGQVSRLQVAQLVGVSLTNTQFAENKVLEVVAETTAPRRELELLLADQPCEVAQEDRAATAAAVADAQDLLEVVKEEQAAIQEEASEVQDSFGELYAEVEEAENQRAAQRAQRAIQEAERQLELLTEAQEQTAREEAAAKAVLRAAQAAAKQRAALSAEEIDEIQEEILNPPTEEELAERAAAEAQARQDAIDAEKREREAKAAAERQAREEAAAAQRREAEERAAKAKAEAEAKRKAEEDQRKAEVEARQKAEAEARAKREAEEKARAEAKAQAEAEAQKKREEEEKARAEAKAKAEAEAQKRREEEEKAAAEARAKAEAEAKAKKEAEEKEKAEAEAKAKKEADAKAEAEAKAQAEAEAKAKKEAEAKAQAEAEAKAQADADAKAKTDADAKAQQEAKAEAATQADAGAEAAAEEAKKNAAEAAQWISNWRNGVKSSEGTVPEAEQQEAAEDEAPQPGGIFAGFKWPWQQEEEATEEAADEGAAEESQASPDDVGQAAQAAEGTAGLESDVAGAREWINRWRARSLEAKLPVDNVNAN